MKQIFVYNRNWPILECIVQFSVSIGGDNLPVFCLKWTRVITQLSDANFFRTPPLSSFQLQKTPKSCFARTSWSLPLWMTIIMLEIGSGTLKKLLKTQCCAPGNLSSVWSFAVCRNIKIDVARLHCVRLGGIYMQKCVMFFQKLIFLGAKSVFRPNRET